MNFALFHLVPARVFQTNCYCLRYFSFGRSYVNDDAPIRSENEFFLIFAKHVTSRRTRAKRISKNKIHA